MNPSDLAAKLIGVENENEATRILAESKGVSEIELAYAIKASCYDSWTNEPALAQKAAAALRILSGTTKDPEITCIFDWISGIAAITESQLDNSLERLQSAYKGFIKLGKIYEAAQTQNAKMIPLGLLGDYDSANEIGLKALATFESFKDEISAAKIETNLSVIAARQGKHRKSKEFCIAARNRLSSLGDTQWVLFAEIDLAVALAELNEFAEAEAQYRHTLEIVRKQKMHLMEASILGGLGNLQTFRGQYGDALRHLELSRLIFERLEMPHQTAIADLEIAEIYQVLNLRSEASDIYKRVTKLLKRFKLRGEEARARLNAGKLAFENGEAETARLEFTNAISLFEEEENPAGRASATILRARLENESGNFETALSLVESAQDLIREGHFPRLELEADYLRGETLLSLGRLDEAETIFANTVERARTSEQLNIAASSLVSFAKLALSRNRTEEAVRCLQEAVNIVESLRDPIPAEEFRMTYFSDKLAPFELLSDVLLDQKSVEKAFVYAARAKARTLVEAVSSVSHKDLQDTDRNSVLREKLNWHYSRLTRDSADEGSASKEIVRIEKQLSELKLRESSLATGVHANPQTANWAALPSELIQKVGKDRALIEFTRSAGHFSAFVVNDEGIQHFDKIAAESEVLFLLEGFRFQVESMRYESSRIKEFSSQSKEAANAYLGELFKLLVAPMGEPLKRKHLIVVPVGSLFYVPFNALFDGQHYLIESREIVTSPGSAVWNKMTNGALRNKRNALIIAYADESIPWVEKESVSVSERFENAKVLLGQDATTQNYIRLSAGYDFIHLACHGEFRSDSPMYSNLKLADGFLTVRDIASNRLDAELVTLSACETGLNKIFPGNEILGLARGFLNAGANNIVMSYWTVNDAATERLMSEFYTNLEKGKSIPAALRDAQRSQIEAGLHPYFWAPFGIIGQ